MNIFKRAMNYISDPMKAVSDFASGGINFGTTGLFGSGIGASDVLNAGLDYYGTREGVADNQKHYSAEQQKQRDFLSDQARRDRELQMEFAKNSTGWQLKDLFEAADESGIHRLAALGGASGTSYTPVGGIAPGVSPYAGSKTGAGISALSRILDSTRLKEAQALERRGIEARIKLDESEAELNTARATTMERNAAAAAIGGPAEVDYADPDSKSEALLRKVIMPDGSVRHVPVGPELNEVLTGFGLWVYDKSRDAIVLKDPKERPKKEQRRPDPETRAQTPKTYKPTKGSRGRQQ